MIKQGDRPRMEARRSSGIGEIVTKHRAPPSESGGSTGSAYQAASSKMLAAISLGWRPFRMIERTASINETWASHEDPGNTEASWTQLGQSQRMGADLEGQRIVWRLTFLSRPRWLSRCERSAGVGFRKLAALFFVIGVAAGSLLTHLAEKQPGKPSIVVVHEPLTATPQKRGLQVLPRSADSYPNM
ncbi:hypothetical protein [Paraburkholderia sp. DHOC27]|uniref:hypothetical protein n=1 Tax=Paraburkholderia sp. DHOC27 TaxID=2303330 RepID=UPI0011C1C7D9|nr:hypothetical protein [Paraburkholderia sp. DHOC27]